MLDHFLTLGGNEIVNSARAFGYAQTSGCRAAWLNNPDCDTVSAAENGGNLYDYMDIADAPWYDPDDPDTTSRFLGLYGIDILGLSDSTRSATTVEKNGDGGVVTGYRHASREVRVRGWMTAKGGDALEAGMTWLRNVLEPDACGVHGGACGVADSGFFVDCPPPRREVVEYSDWALQATNLVTNPRLETNAAGYGGSGGWDTLPHRQFEVNPSGHDWTWRALAFTNDADQVITYQVSGLTPGQTYRWGFWARAASFEEGGISARLSASPSLTAPPTGGSTAVPADEGWLWYSFVAQAPAAQTYIGIHVLASVVDVDVAMTGLIVLEGEGTSLAPEDYFDGSHADSDLERFAWTGTADASTSTRETRTVALVPEGEETYQPYISPYRRFLHSVRCVSGPFTIMERESQDGQHVGRLVEFTLLAAVPWVYGVPKDIDVPPMVPTVVQDIAYNLAPYPSAERAGVAVVTATNYCKNPSLESNGDGWAHVAGNPVPAANVTSGRVTGELAAVGTASYRSVFTAASAGGPGYFGNNQAGTTTEIPTAAGTRLSISMWSAVVVMAGAPVITELRFFAFWLNGSTVLGSTDLGTVPVAGGAVNADSLLPPAGANRVVVEARCVLASWAAGNVVRLYSDALAVTNP